MTTWRFWIDRGGTFTDIIAQTPQGTLVTHKLLSEHPERYEDAALAGIRQLMNIPQDSPLPTADISEVRMGTTVATNALLERKGEPTVLVITQGFRDVLRIGYQQRPQIFALQIQLPEMLYSKVIEVTARMDSTGQQLCAVDEVTVRRDLEQVYAQGYRACAVVLIHGYRYPDHELTIARLAHQVGFTQVSVSHQVSPLPKLVSRGDTTVLDSYLSPIVQRYAQQVARQIPGVQFMQSNGGLVSGAQFQGKDSLLSGPAGGVVGAVESSLKAGFTKIIGFDMGGTSTDVFHFQGTQLSNAERVLETEVAGVRLRVPMLAVHTIAAGGGSVLTFDGQRFLVGPQSAGANPGPACYRRGGPLTITDCNVLLGKLQPEHFPAIFGPEGDLPLDVAIVREKFAVLAQHITQTTGASLSLEAIAEGFLKVAVEHMARAIRQVSVARGHDLTNYTLVGYGGAAGQHICLVAEALGIHKIYLHPFASVLSAYGMGLAQRRVLRERTIEAKLTPQCISELEQHFQQLAIEAITRLTEQGVEHLHITMIKKIHLHYEGSNTTLPIEFIDHTQLVQHFEIAHQQYYGFSTTQQAINVAFITLEGIEVTLTRAIPIPSSRTPGTVFIGPQLLLEPASTLVIEPGWQAVCREDHAFYITRVKPLTATKIGTVCTPIYLEIFNHSFMSIAEQMGAVLQHTALSVNIKERLDFSCAIFDAQGNLIANAPHMPVHLGSMGDSVLAVLDKHTPLQPGMVYVLNNPYAGGTHLPDITVVTPVFVDAALAFFVASRGHHADVGGISPGSMPPFSQTIHEEGILLDNILLVKDSIFQEEALLQVLMEHVYPARNPHQNIADLKAQVAANQRGLEQLQNLVTVYSLATVQAYMGHVQDYAEQAVRRAIDQLAHTLPSPATFSYEMDNGTHIQVAITFPGNQTATLDFAGTSPQQNNNFNAPTAITKAAVLYVFRTLIDTDIPLNAGCLRPLTIRIPAGSLLAPTFPAAVVAGNVETSQHITDTLFGALHVVAASQGTMNNLTFGNAHYQYYETLCGGSGAGPTFCGTDAIHTHMTNSRLTDPEILERRYPVRLEEFRIRSSGGGEGRYAGGAGVRRKFRFLEPMTVAILAGHRRIPPYGLAGGTPGAVGHNLHEQADGTTRLLPGCTQITVSPGEALIIETPGGGGWGSA